MSYRAIAALGFDVAMALAAWALAFWLRFDFAIPRPQMDALAAALPWVAGVHAAAFLICGTHKGLWRYAGVLELQRILLAVLAGGLAVPVLLTGIGLGARVPGPAFVIAPVLLALLLSGARLVYRTWNEGRVAGATSRPGAAPVLVIGAGEASARLLKDLEGSSEWQVAGLLDDDSAKHGGAIRGVRVIGRISAVAEVSRRLGVTQAVIAMPGVAHSLRGRAVALCTEAGLRVMTVPAHEDIVSGRVSISALREVELDDLLGRDPVRLDDAGLRAFLGGKRVLVTGAGGSIGAELCRQILRYAPERLILLDSSELALYSIEQEFVDRGLGGRVAAWIGDTRDAARVGELFARHVPQVVFHAAAYKHVPLLEEENAFQAVSNNVLGTAVVARAAQVAGVKRFVFVSTDKAVNPTSVMGASKRLAEIVCQARQTAGTATEFVTVRFGNVLGSTGSVVPRFREQIARGGPVTVTHPEVERYFMSIPEAAQLVLQAALMGRGGEIYVLDMGEPVRIVNLAKQLIRLSGFTETEVEIVYTGLRPGEKLYEEPLAGAEATLPTPHPKLRVAKAGAIAAEKIAEEVLRWLEQPEDVGPVAVRARLRVWIPEYSAARQ
jgi:FlaA1/EpsC-like NDP-sugar epimerase